jgi:hypothetical protein
MRDMRNFPEVFRRLETLHEDMPDFAGGYGAHLRVLREQDRLDDAVRLGARARALFPADAGVAIEYARAVKAADGALAACDILAAAVAGSPDDPHAAAEHVAMLAEAGLLDAAEAACLAATARFRFHPRPLIELADVAMRRGDMPAALARWIDGATRFPQHPVFQRGIARARLAMIGRSAAGEVLADESGGGDSIRHLLMRFESLGGPGMGCEFGLVQRQAGAEPLGLLRWTGITAGKLREALAARFDGVGSPAQTELSLNEASREYDVFDRRFAMRTHSFVRETAMPRDKLFEDVCAQAGYLRRKLLRELEAARKVFVFRFGAVAPAAGEIEGLFEALQDFGELTLLCVVNADDRHRAGSVQMLRPRLLVGYAPELLAWGLTETASWHEICRVAVGFRE